MAFGSPLIRYEESPLATLTDAKGLNRFSRRIEHIYSRNARRISGKRVLDLACHTGALAYSLLTLGADRVVGVEARSEAIERGRTVFDASPYRKRMSYVQGDLFEFLGNAKPGEYDVITCTGFLYHTVRHADFYREMKRLRPETVFVDTNIAENYFWFGRKAFGRPAALFAYSENPALARDTIDPDGVVYWPSASYLEMMLRGAGYDAKRINFRA